MDPTIVIPETFELLHGGHAIRCRRCRKVSYNRNDVANRFCGYCHQFHDDIPEDKRAEWIADKTGLP